MTKRDRMELADGMRLCVAALQERGRFTAREAVDMVMARYASQVQEASERLIRESLSALARRVMKETETLTETGQMALDYLPEEMKTMRVPGSICVPPRRRKDGSADEKDFIWTRIVNATDEEVERYLEMLAVGIRDYQVSFDSIRTFRAYYAPYRLSPQERVGDILARIKSGQPVRQPVAMLGQGGNDE